MKGGTYTGGFNTHGKLTISGGKTNEEVVVGEFVSKNGYG